MGYRAIGQAGETETDSVVLRRVDRGVADLITALKAEDRRRKMTLILTGAGVLFAAVKLGFIAVPHIRRWRGAGE